MDLKRVVAGFNVEWISLVGSPANQKKIILKSANAKPSDQTEKQWDFPLTKVDVEKRIVYGLVYSGSCRKSYGKLYGLRLYAVY